MRQFSGSHTVKNLMSILLLLGALIASSAAAQAPVAMRVEVEPLEVTAEAATVRVVIQVSPEDRVRIGRNAIVKIELDGEVPRGQSPMWAVKIKDDGSAEVETVWPPGEHELQVEIESPSGRESGLWVGRVRIPGEVRETAPQPTPVPTPELPPVPVPVPVPEPVTESVSVAEEAEEPVAEAKSDTGTAVASATVLASAQETASAPAAEPPPPLPAREAPVSESTESVRVPAAEPMSEVDDSMPEPEPEPESPATVADEIPEPVVEEPTAAEPPAAEMQPEEPEPVTIEVLRGEPVEAPSAGVETGAAPSPEPIEEAGNEFSSKAAAAYEGWAAGASDTVEFTAIVTRNREPAEGLTPGDLTLKVAGNVVAIDQIGDAAKAPLLLGAAVDLAPETAGRWSGTGRQLVPLLARASEGRGRLFFSASGWEGGWENGADRLPDVLESPSTGDVAALLIASLGQFSGQSGRNFLLLITDGRSDLPKSAWREAVVAAEVSGVPVLVIALWDKDFKQGIRKQLQNIARVSGGRLFLAQGADQLDSVTERYGSMLDAGIAVRFSPPAGMKPASAVSLTAHDKSIEVTAPSKVR